MDLEPFGIGATMYLGTTLKDHLRRLIGPRLLGYLDYYRSTEERRQAWGGPFNGQRVRQAIFRDVVTLLRPVAIIETGTYIGTTTEIFAATGLPVYSIEANARNHAFARARLWRYPNVHLRNGDSREQLQQLLAGPLNTKGEGALFVYLDAHWNEDLPLDEELEVVFSRTKSVITMIDDFEVPGDSGYLYDNYGAGRTLNAEYIAPVVTRFDLGVFYPAVRSHEESGAQRGCVLLCRDGMDADKLVGSNLLRRA